MKKIRTTTFNYQRLIITPTTANGFHYIHYYTSQPKHTSSNTNNCETTLFFMTRFQFFVGWLNLCSRPQVGAINSEDAASKFMRIKDASSLSQLMMLCYTCLAFLIKQTRTLPSRPAWASQEILVRVVEEVATNPNMHNQQSRCRK